MLDAFEWILDFYRRSTCKMIRFGLADLMVDLRKRKMSRLSSSKILTATISMIKPMQSKRLLHR
jgi:hypothetical protein